MTECRLLPDGNIDAVGVLTIVCFVCVTDKTAYVLVFQILLFNETAKVILFCPK